MHSTSQMCRFQIETGQGLGVEHAVISAVVDSGVVLHTDNVGSLIIRHREPGEGKESSGHSIGRKFMWSRTLESYHTLRLVLAVWN